MSAQPGRAADPPSQAIILAGGAGTRLRSLVSDVPKPLAEVRGRPFIEYLLLQLAEAGIGKAVVLAGYLADALRERLGEGIHGVALTYSVEPVALGTAGALKLAEPHLAGDRWLLMNGDSLFDISLADLVAAHLGSSAAATLALARVSDRHRYGGVTLAPDGAIVAFVEKPADIGDGPRTLDTSAPQCINGGLYMIERTVLDLIPADRPVSLEREVLPLLAERGLRDDGQNGDGLRGEVFAGYFVDIGVPEDFLAAQHERDVFDRLAASAPR